MSGLTDRLQQVAGQATPGPWELDELRRSARIRESWFVVTMAYGGNVETARHIATFDPVLVGAMLDVIEAGHNALSAYYVDAVSPVEMASLADALARFREVAERPIDRL